MPPSRRHLLQAAALAATAIPRTSRTATTPRLSVPRFRLGVPDWGLYSGARPEALALAKRLGFDGVQVSLGQVAPSPGGRPSALKLADRALQTRFLDEANRTGAAIASVALDILHVCPLKSDPAAPALVHQAIPIARALGVQVLMLPFFYDRGLHTQPERDRVADLLREIAPEADRAGLVLALEDELSARDNIRLIERTRSRAVKVYYDVGNSTKQGFDIHAELPWLGRDRIAEVHFKDDPLRLGAGKVDFPRVVRQLADMGFDAWAQIETRPAHKEEVEPLHLKNVAFVRGLMAQAGRAQVSSGSVPL